MSKRAKPKKRAPSWPSDPRKDPMYPFGGPPPLDPEDFVPQPDTTETKRKKSTWGQLKKDYR